ncbi:hypothetical protein C8J57DRAFT_1073772 [Mycena rebaudengoi]|nr:hypothetical protein C8J57DRAFT_1073772 [Mycena rebaudengoi]
MILGCGLARFDGEGPPTPVADRLYKILITESAFLIWKLRNDCVISNEGVPVSKPAVHNRWLQIINERLSIDRNLTSELKHGKQYSLSIPLVLETWKGTLKDEGVLPENWIRGPEVLVGIEPLRSNRPLSPPVGRRGRNR